MQGSASTVERSLGSGTAQQQEGQEQDELLPLAQQQQHRVQEDQQAKQQAEQQPERAEQQRQDLPPQQAGQQQASRQQAGQDWFVADGYELPPECVKHGPLFAGLLDQLRPWYHRGITPADMDQCKPLAPADYNVSLGTHNDDVFTPTFRLLSWDNEIFVTSGGLERVGGYGQQPLHYHMISQIRDTAKRFGLPNVEFAVSFGDHPASWTGDLAAPMCPLFGFTKSPGMLNILIPSGEFITAGYDAWVERMLQDPDGGTPWEQKEERAIGRWTLFENVDYTNRFGHTSDHIRHEHVAHSEATNYSYTSCMDAPDHGMPLSEQRKFKYTLNTDGFSASTRFAKLLAIGQASPAAATLQLSCTSMLHCLAVLFQWFYHAVHPWVHYVPSGYNGLEEVDNIVAFLRQHDGLACAIMENARRFAATHLVSEGRHCYLKVLFEEMAKLQGYMKDRKLEDFPSRITYDDDVARYHLDLDRLKEGTED